MYKNLFIFEKSCKTISTSDIMADIKSLKIGDRKYKFANLPYYEDYVLLQGVDVHYGPSIKWNLMGLSNWNDPT